MSVIVVVFLLVLCYLLVNNISNLPAQCCLTDGKIPEPWLPTVSENLSEGKCNDDKTAKYGIVVKIASDTHLH